MVAAGPALNRFIAASGFANLADGIATIAWAWTASALTRDPLLISLVAVALRLPWAVFALAAGIVTDRADRRLLILRMDLLRLCAFLAAGLALWFASPLDAPRDELVASSVAYIALLVCALVVGAAEVFRDNAAQTMLPSLVPPEALERANGRLWSTELVGNALAGPPLGAFLFALFVALPFMVNAGIYGCAALLVAGISGSFKPVQNSARNWREELKKGFVFLRSAHILRVLAWLTGLWNLFFQMVMIALILHAQENLGLSSAAYGLILAAGAVGGILGGLLGERIVRQLGPARAAQWSLFSSAPAFAAMALAPGPISLALVLVAFEFAGLVWNTVSVSTRQRTIPNELLGRVNSIYRLLAWGMMPLGLLLSGLIVRLLDGPLDRSSALIAPFWVATFGFSVVCLFGWRVLDRGLKAVAT